MAITIKKDLMLPIGHPNRPNEKLIDVLSLVFHWTANKSKGADDIANARYFGRPFEKDNGRFEEKGTDNVFRYGSAHYIVDQDSIQNAIPENEKAYHVGANEYTKLGEGKLKGKPNNYTIGIELCVNEGNDWKKTLENAIELGSDIIIRHKLSKDDIVRHYDVTGKDCPKPFVDDVKAWEDFKVRLMKRVAEKTAPKTPIKPATKPAPKKTIPLVPAIDLRHGGVGGDNVRMLQKCLVTLGYKIAIDGVFGDATEKALKNLQIKHKLTADGVFGVNSRKLIKELLSKL